MHEYTAETTWLRDQQPFIDNRYSRRHVIRFDGGAEVAGSSSPLSVRVPMSDVTAVDPEELFVASLSSCHMLWFLSIAAAGKYCVDRYVDMAQGRMEKGPAGKMCMSVVTLRPRVTFSGERLPDESEVRAMHHRAHDECFIAHSVRTEVLCEPVFA